MSANINVNLNHCELTPSVEQSANGEFIWLANEANTDRIMYLASIFFCSTARDMGPHSDHSLH